MSCIPSNCKMRRTVIGLRYCKGWLSGYRWQCWKYIGSAKYPISWVPEREAQLHPGQLPVCQHHIQLPKALKTVHHIPSSQKFHVVQTPPLSWLPVTFHLWLSALGKQQPLKAKAGPFLKSQVDFTTVGLQLVCYFPPPPAPHTIWQQRIINV